MMCWTYLFPRSVAIRWKVRTLTTTNSWSCSLPTPATPWPSTPATGTSRSSMNGRTRRHMMLAVTRPRQPPVAFSSTLWDPSESVGSRFPSGSVSIYLGPRPTVLPNAAVVPYFPYAKLLVTERNVFENFSVLFVCSYQNMTWFLNACPYLVLTHMPGEIYHRRLMPLLLCYFCIRVMSV